MGFFFFLEVRVVEIEVAYEKSFHFIEGTQILCHFISVGGVISTEQS